VRESNSMVANADWYSKFEIYNYNFASSGKSEDLYKFMRELRTNMRIIDLKALKVLPAPNGRIQFSINFWAYNMNPDYLYQKRLEEKELEAQNQKKRTDLKNKLNKL